MRFSLVHEKQVMLAASLCGAHQEAPHISQ